MAVALEWDRLVLEVVELEPVAEGAELHAQPLNLGSWSHCLE